MERIALLGIVAITAVASAAAYTVVTKDGRKLEAEAPPTFQGGRARIVLSGGLGIELAEADVDRTATAKANEGPRKPAAFTNEDLAKAKGLSASDGKVTAEGMDSGARDPARHAPRDPARSTSGRAPDPPSEAEARVAELERRIDELNTEIRSRCREWSFSNPTNDCDPKLQEELRDTITELTAAKVERDVERQAAHEDRLSTFEGKDGDERRARAIPALEARVETLRRSLAEAEERLSDSGSTAADLNRKLQVAADLTRAEKELAAAQEE